MDTQRQENRYAYGLDEISPVTTIAIWEMVGGKENAMVWLKVVTQNPQYNKSTPGTRNLVYWVK